MSDPFRASPIDQTADEWLADHGGQPTKVKPDLEPANESGECMVESSPLVPARDYKLAYVEHYTQKVKGSGKLNISFAITEGADAGEILPAFYRVTLKGPPGKFGLFSASKQGDYYEQMCDLFPELVHGRSDRISPQRLKGKKVLCEVATVTTKWDGKERKPHTQYSKVKRMIKLC